MNDMKLLLAFSAFGLFAISSFAQLSFETRSAVDQAVTNAIAKAGIAGASVAIVRDGKLAYAHAYGFSDLQSRKSATPAMRYKIGSNS